MLVRRRAAQAGFTLIELLVALGIFLIVCGAAFTLLGSSQQRYHTDSQLLTTFQEARLGLDQIIRDVDDSGFPPPTFAGLNPTLYTSTPFAWSPGYTVPTPCTIGISCVSPGDFDLIVETNPNPNPQDPSNLGVQWIRYTLQGSTLMRGMAQKAFGHDPVVDTSANLAPFVQNVVNNATAGQITQFQINYPNMFPTGAVPIFSYTCDTGTFPQPCPVAGSFNSPQYIREVTVTIIVSGPVLDANGQPRLVQLVGRGRRVNPSQ